MLQVDSVGVVDVDSEPLRCLMNGQRRKTPANAVVLQGHWCTEHSPVAVSAPRPSSTPVAFHCWSTMSVISLRHLRDKV